jgi:hypothetical protein
MHVTSVWSAVRRPALVALGLALALVTAPPMGAQDQAQPGLVFGSDAGMVFNQIKPDHTANFEMVMGRLREALYKSEDPVRQQQAAGWKVYRSPATQNGNVLYLFFMDPAVRGADYTVSKILSEAFEYEEVTEIFKVYAAAYAAGQSLINLNLVSDFGKRPAND